MRFLLAKCDARSIELRSEIALGIDNISHTSLMVMNKDRIFSTGSDVSYYASELVYHRNRFNKEDNHAVFYLPVILSAFA